MIRELPQHLDQYFTLDPQMTYVVADRLSNETMGAIRKAISPTPFNSNGESYKLLENWFELRFTLSPQEHNLALKDLFGVDPEQITKNIIYNQENTYFSPNHLFHKERYTQYIFDSLNKLIAHKGVELKYDRAFHTTLTHFLDSVKMIKPQNKPLQEFVFQSIPNIKTQWDYFLYSLSKDLLTDPKQLHFKANIDLLEILIKP